MLKSYYRGMHQPGTFPDVPNTIAALINSQGTAAYFMDINPDNFNPPDCNRL